MWKVALLYTDGCGFCNKFKQNELDTLNQMLTATGRPPVELIDARHLCHNAPDHLQGSGVPHFVFFDRQGRFVSSVTGYRRAEDLAAHMGL